MKQKKILLIISLAVCIGVCGTGAFFFYKNIKEVEAKERADHQMAAKKAFASLFTDKEQKLIKLHVTKQKVETAKKAVDQLENDDIKKQTYKKRLRHIDSFLEIRDLIMSYLPNSILKSDTTDENIETMRTKFNKLEPGFQSVLKEMFDLAVHQRQALIDLESLVQSFYADNVVKEDINTDDFNALKEILKTLPQRDIAEGYMGKVTEIQQKLDYLEEQERQRIEAERQAAVARALAESERLRKENEAIQAANVIIPNVPLIDQSINVHNGCEVASLLMALQHFGINRGMSLRDIANAVPKTNDPHTGFVLDIFTLYPRNVAHWIAPDALSAFGQTYHAGVANISGSSVEQLKAEINAGNPVVIYATYGFAWPTAWCWNGEIPVNMHVMLMVGYNKITGDIIVNDPWGGRQILVSSENFAREYNRRHYAVAIRP